MTTGSEVCAGTGHRKGSGRFAKMATAVAMLASTAQVAEAAREASDSCITSTEFRAGMAFLVPTMVLGIRDKCKTQLPRTAYLTQNGEQLVGRFRASGMVDKEALNSLMGKIQTDRNIPSAFNPMMADMIAQSLVSKMQDTLKPSNCLSVDKALALIDPLPPENVVGLFELVGSAVSRDDARKSRANGKTPKITLCEAL